VAKIFSLLKSCEAVFPLHPRHRVTLSSLVR
jgi:hypothetical protein